MYGARVIKSLSGGDRVHMEFDAGGTFAANDFVKFDDSGEVVVGTAAAGILGVAREAGTSSTDNVLIDITMDMVVLMDNDLDSDTSFAKADIGLYGDFVGGTGAMQINTDTLGTTITGLLCLKNNPQGYGYDSDTSIGLFYVMERQIGENVI